MNNTKRKPTTFVIGFRFGGDGEIRTLENALTSYTISNRAPSTGLGDISVTPQYYTLSEQKNQALFIKF